mgnify:CR=1 FL=1
MLLQRANRPVRTLRGRFLHLRIVLRGNLRELDNVINRARILAENNRITLYDLRVEVIATDRPMYIWNNFNTVGWRPASFIPFHLE